MSITRERLNEIVVSIVESGFGAKQNDWASHQEFASDLLKAIEAELEVVGYALYREGRQVGTERTLACANHWVEADIYPLVALPLVKVY